MGLKQKKLPDIPYLRLYFHRTTQPTFICSELSIETLEQGVKYV